MKFLFLVTWQIYSNFARNNAILSAKFKLLTLQCDAPTPPPIPCIPLPTPSHTQRLSFDLTHSYLEIVFYWLKIMEI